MIRKLALVLAFVSAAASALAQAPLNINGVSDKSTYTDTASFTVPSTAGYSQVVYLNNVLVPSDVTHTLNRADYYEVTVSRTNDATLAVSNRTVRFIISSSNRGSPEKGLIEWLPYPSVPSAADEFAGASMRLIVPQNYPAGLEIPVIAWIENPDGQARRANGYIRAPGFEAEPLKIMRGVGSGFLPRQSSGATVTYNAQLQGLSATKQVNIDADTTWTTVAGTINSDTTWPANSRIHVTSALFITNATLTVGEGTVVKLNPLVTITNYGRIVINGTATQPVVFTSTNRIVPDYNVGAWGGFVMRTNGAEMVANYLIVNGAGGAKSWSFSPGSSHKSHQPVFHLHFGATLSMSNSAVINTHGQYGNGYRSTMTLDHCLIQRAVTGGEWDTCTNILYRSALIEFPEENGQVNAAIADYDYDAFYMIKGTNLFQDTLIGFCKDDALDAGSDGSSDSLGSVRVQHCWIESALHESMAWSGHNRKTFTYDTVSINSGQGIENGWTDGSASYGGTQTSPDIYASRLLSTANSVGARVGDNYNWGYRGFMRLTNSLVIYNYRDVFLKTWNNPGTSWDTNSWDDRIGQIALEDTALTAADSRFPSAPVWNPATDAPRLAFWMTTPPASRVGIGIAAWTNSYPLGSITNGVPVRLSTFTTNVVSVSYALEGSAGVIASGTLTFQPGETLKRIFPNSPAVLGESVVRVVLGSATGGEVTGRPHVFYVQQGTQTALINAGAVWKYHDKGQDLGTSWRMPVFDDSGWSNGPAQLGFGDNDEATKISRSNTTMTASVTTFYFRRAINVTNADTIGDLSMWLLRDDGAVVYINGSEVFRSSSMPAGTISYSTFANALGSAPSDNTIDTATLSATNLVNGTNVIAVEIHQFDPPSSDASFDFSLTANPKSATPQHLWREPIAAGTTNGFRLLWDDASYTLEEAPTVTGQWSRVVAPAPFTVAPTNGQRFYRLTR